MKTERSDSKSTTAARGKGEGERAESKRSEDPEAFERALRKSKKKVRGDEKRPAKHLAKKRPDVGDEESWRGRIVEGEAQIDKREARRGSVEQERAETKLTRDKTRREQRRDDTHARAFRQEQTDERVQDDTRRGESARKTSSSDARQATATGEAGSPLPGRDEIQQNLAREGAPAERVEGARADTQRASAASEEIRSRHAEVAEIADKIVESARSGFDEKGRKMLSMTMEIPGRGRLEIRLRKHGSKMQVELAAESPAFGRLLRRSRKDIKQKTRERGVQLSSVRVTR